MPHLLKGLMIFVIAMNVPSPHRVDGYDLGSHVRLLYDNDIYLLPMLKPIIMLPAEQSAAV
jgi:hypothetical protein